ncbi:MAG: HAMP domain-containing sensor histidine kinase [candidate division WOR-3 bacterium]
MIRLQFGSRFLQYYFSGGIFILAIFGYCYTRYLAQQIERETEVRSKIYAQFMRQATLPYEDNSAELNIIFEEVIKKIDFPVVITDAAGNLITAINIASKNLRPERLAKIIKRLDKEHDPIVIAITENDTVRILNTIHYGVSNATKILRYYHFVQLAFLVLFIFIGFWAIIIYHKREQELVWTALAKETAHQLATPISSLAGWLEMLQTFDRLGEKNVYLNEMRKDLDRMKEILERFSRIGTPPELKENYVKEIVEKTVEFIRRRTSKHINFILEINYNPCLKIDDVLFSWTLENLIKNSIDAIGLNRGEIRIKVNKTPDDRFLEIDVIDTGAGVNSKIAKKIFKPGEGTKKFGWGVGLTLAKRIVENYHRGKLFLKCSQPGYTMFTILLPLKTC